MITKITIDYPNKKSYEANPQYKMDSFKALEEDAVKSADIYEKIAALISYFNTFPEHNIPVAIKLFFADVTPTINKKTKKYRVYWIPFLYIHEEDK